MKKAELVYRQILFRALEENKFVFTQSELSKQLDISLSIVNSAIKKLESMGAVKIHQRSFHVQDMRKILYFWASIRNIEKDIIFKARIDVQIREIERILPDVVYTAYTAYKFRFNDVPADYSEIYVYADENELSEIKKRILDFNVQTSSKSPNFFVLKKDSGLKNPISLSQIFVDLWNIKEWYAKDFLNALESKLNLQSIS